MKKYVICLLLIFLLCGCAEKEIFRESASSAPPEQSHAPMVTYADCLSGDGEEWYIRLPESGRTLKVREEYTAYLYLVDDGLVAEADPKIPEGAHLYLEFDKEGFLCLCGEDIVFFEPSGEYEDDHRHEFYSFRITKSP